MISFQSEGVEIPKLDFKKISAWLNEVASSEGRRVGNIVYRFCSDEVILQTNRDFLNHDYYTDIITFDYSIGSKIGGDILISLDTVRSNADSLGMDFFDELHRVVVHGVLHLCGINDKSPEERREMESAENRALDMLRDLD